MHVLIVHSHPEPKSFNGDLKTVAEKTLRRMGHSVEVSDLYGERFDPLERPAHYRNRKHPDFFATATEQRHAFETGSLPADILREIARLDRADLVIFQFPLWNHGPPAILKGWFDRVFIYGGIYTSTMRYDRGYFCGRRAICSVTAGAPASAFEPGGRAGDINCLMWPLHLEFYCMGFTVLRPFVSYGIRGYRSGYKEDPEFMRKLADYKAAWTHRLETIDDADAIGFPSWNDWDENGRLKVSGEQWG